MINQAQFMRQFNETHREEFNPELFKRENQEIIDSIEQVVRSCERDKYFTLKLLSFNVIYDYEEMYNTLREHEEKRKKKNSKLENSYDFINIKDTDIMLVKLEWLVRHNGIERQEINGKTVEVVNPEEILEVLIELPRFTKGYYFKLAGKYYTTTFQIVDGSTYNNSTANQAKVDTVSFKTIFSPFRVFRSFRDMVDIRTKETIKVIEYQSIIFNNTVNPMYFLLAHFGLYGLSSFLDIDCVTVSTMPNLDENYLCFNKHGIFISCPRFCFEDSMVQSYVATLYSAINKDTTINDLFNIRYWLKNLGTAFKNSSIDKGLFVLDSVDGIYDNITKDHLHLPEEQKENFYCVIRWLLQNFSELRVKENTDLRAKRLRISEYIAQLYAMKLNKGLYRCADLGRRITLKKVIQAVYTQPMFIINSLTSASMSNLVSFRDMVNDNDGTVATSYSQKGISSMADNNSSIQPTYRYVDPSYVGILDLDASSSSDPGTSGVLCPMLKLQPDGFITDYQEPNTYNEKYGYIREQYKQGKDQPITFDRPPEQFPYDKLRDEIIAENLELNKIVCPIESLTDPNIVYTCSSAKIEKEEKQPIKSLFTIRNDED